MKKVMMGLIIMLISFVSLDAKANSNENHVGFYLYGMAGFMNLNNDTNQRVDPPLEFGNSVEFAFGFTMGYNVTDAIAPELQFSYSTTTDDTPSGEAREHALSIRANLKYSFLTNAGFNATRSLKIYPYIKGGGVAHGLYINASNDLDKVGSWGYGFTAGGGVEFNYKKLYFGLDISNDFLYLQEETEEIAGQEIDIIEGGFDYQISMMFGVGVHF
jgi:opacity protein-like surface antigen